VNHTLLLLSSLVGGSAVIAWRVREGSRPVTMAKIIAPPLGMSTGFLMFLFPPARIPLSWAVLAFACGALLLAYPLLKTSELRRAGDHVLVQRGKAFLWILLGLLSVRFAARTYVEQYVSELQTGAIFFVLAFGMIARWRFDMFFQYRALMRAPSVHGERRDAE
jgi:membrane protein CcdC involved in cytochrome C biogenesis